MPGHDLLQLFDGLGDLHAGVHVHGQADDEILARQLADAFHDGARKPHAVLKAAAPFIIAPVVEWQPELVDDGIVGGKQFDPVEAGLLCPPRLPARSPR